jgi:hypothetical protein
VSASRAFAHVHRNGDPQAVRTRDEAPREAKVVEVIAVDFQRGEGCCDQDAYRRCTAYYSMEGALLFVVDPWPSPAYLAATEENPPA